MNQKLNQNGWPLALLAAIIIFVLPLCLSAQVGSASLGGVVQDSSGAIVPDATVTARNLSTGQERKSRTSSNGSFAFSALPSGDYDITVARGGFSSYTLAAVHLDPGDAKALPVVALKNGEVSASVTVTSETAGIPLDNGQLSSTISSQELERLSVVGRDAQELEKTLPGFGIRNQSNQNVAPDFSIVEVGQPTPYASNGAPVAGIVLKLDGANLTDAGNFGAKLQNLNNSFVSEVQVQTSNFGVDQSNGPVVISAVTKSGTEKYHGSLYTFARTSSLNSNDWLANHSGFARPDDRFVCPGGTLSGPIPHTKKLTFFVGAEEDAQRNVYAYQSAGNAIIHALVPSAAMRAGDFSTSTLASYLGPNVNNYGTLGIAPTVGEDGSGLVNGNIAAFRGPGALALINNLLPLPNRAGGATGGHPIDVEADSEFLLGHDLLIAPSPYPEAPDRYTVEFPTKRWYDFWTGKEVQPLPKTPPDPFSPPNGLDQIPLATQVIPEINQLPVYVRAGAILPMAPLTQSTSELPSGPLTLRVYAGEDCRGELYEDDGVSFAYKKGQFLRMTFSCTVTPEKLELSLSSHTGSYPAWWKQVHVEVYGWSGPEHVTASVNKERREVRTVAQHIEVDFTDSGNGEVLTLQ